MEWPQSPYSWSPGDMPFGDYEPQYFPIILSKCPVCFSLVEPRDESKHKEWHGTLS